MARAPRSRILHSLTAAAGLILPLLVTVQALATSDARGVDAVRLIPLAEAPQAAAPGASPGKSGPVSPRAAAVGSALRAQTSALRGRSAALSAARGAPLTSEQSEAFEALRGRRGGGVEVRTRRRVGTPRQIRGAMLEPAAAGLASGEDRDLATAHAFLRANRALLRIDDPDSELSLRRRQRDHLGRRHLRFEQRYHGLAVWPAELIVHLDPQGRVDLMDGIYVPTPRKVSRDPALTADVAVQRARDAIPTPGAEVPPARSSELVLYASGRGAPRLAFKVDLPVSIAEDWRVFVDARSGAIISFYNRVATENVAGSGIDLGGETRPLNVWKEGATYYIVDTSKNMYDPTSNPPQPDATRGTIIIGDSENRPPTNQPATLGDPVFVTAASPSGPWLRDAVSAAHNFSETYDYYEQRYSRTSLDDQGGSILAFVRLGENFSNAFFNSEGSFMAFGDAKPFAGALDIVAHELTHGVTFHSAKLEYLDQSGALNEAFSDIFGEAVEAFSTGSADWINGTFLADPRSRNLEDPSSVEICCGRNYPSKFSEFIQPSDPFLDNFLGRDNGGVHINSSIVNHAFYQLAVGLPGAIGIADAERIFYRALTVHLVRFSEFIDARLACIQSSEELFGVGSVQAQKTAAAFDFVEIFDSEPTPGPSPFPGVTDALDSTLFIAFGQEFGLLRRETGLGDPTVGKYVAFDVAPTRAAVSGDGTFATFVDGDDDVCLMLTEVGFDIELCLLMPGLASSVAMSTSGDVYGFVFLDGFGDPENRITVFDLSLPDGHPDAIREFTLVAPALDGGTIETVLFADAMDFTADERFLVYDALNEVTFSSGGMVSVWSVYAVELETGVTFTIVPPIAGLDIAYPSMSQTSDSFITFDAFDGFDSAIFAGDLDTGDVELVAFATGGYGVPGYTGDDGAIVFSDGDSVPTGFSLYRQPLAADRMTPVGASELWLEDADFGVIYRRGTFVPEPGAALLQLAAAATLAALARRRRAERSLRVLVRNAG